MNEEDHYEPHNEVYVVDKGGLLAQNEEERAQNIGSQKVEAQTKDIHLYKVWKVLELRTLWVLYLYKIISMLRTLQMFWPS